jgi:hypothetical protein
MAGRLKRASARVGPRGGAVRASERRERTARALLERPVGGLPPGLPVAAAALDVSPGVRAVQGLEDGEPRQAMRAVELTRDVPAHVPEQAAEVEDDAPQTSPLPEGASVDLSSVPWQVGEHLPLRNSSRLKPAAHGKPRTLSSTSTDRTVATDEPLYQVS